MDVAYKQQQLNKQVQLLSHKDINAILAEEHGPRYLEYRRAWAAGMNLEEVPDFPLSIEIETNNFCNYKCNMCVFASKDLHPDVRSGAPKSFMDFDLFTKIIDEGEKHGLPALTYGFMSEPLLHPDITRMCSYAADKGVIDQRLGSNGRLLTRDISRGLVASGLSRLEISVDAVNAETYAKIRRGGSFEHVFRNIHDFLEERDKAGTIFPLLRVSFLRLNVNNHELEEFMEYWQQYADYFSIQEPLDYSLEVEDSELAFKTPSDKQNFHCDKQFQRMFMRWDGSALACGHIHGWDEFKLGNAATESIYDMWHSEQLEELRELHRRGEYYVNPICNHCVRQTNTAEDNEDRLTQ